MKPKPFIPYGRQCIDEDDIAAVVEVLQSDWLTTGPKVDEFEKALVDYTGAGYAIAVNSGTAALHCAMYAVGVNPGDEVIVPAMTFAASANCIVYQGGTPVFADVDPDTLLIDPVDVRKKITSRTKAIIAVDYAGQPCDYDELRKIADGHGLFIVGDACHALGAEYKGRKIGLAADLTVFSFHPVKHITTGEGGMIATDDKNLEKRMRMFRNHGINRDFRQRGEMGSWFYEIADIGYNYRITDIQCALGISQLKKMPNFLSRRRTLAALYDEAFAEIPGIAPLGRRSDVLSAIQSGTDLVGGLETHPRRSGFSRHAYHLYVVKIDYHRFGIERQELFTTLRNNGIGVNVHYIPVHTHPFYKREFQTRIGQCPNAEDAYRQILSLPLHPEMSKGNARSVCDALLKSSRHPV